MENPKIRFKGFTKDWEQRKLIDDHCLKSIGLKRIAILRFHQA